MRHEERAQDDGFRSGFVPGLRSSADASRLAEEVALACARLLALAAEPGAVDGMGLYGELGELAREDPERATWGCFLLSYLCPSEGPGDPFAGARAVLGAGPAHGAPSPAEGLGEEMRTALGEAQLGPRTSHDRARGGETLLAFLRWWRPGDREGAGAFIGDESWTPRRRFGHIFERVALPGLTRAARFELLVLLGRLGIHPLQADALHLGGARGAPADECTLAAKRVFGIGDPLLLERRAAELAAASQVPLESLDAGLANWGAAARATFGLPGLGPDEGARERLLAALGA